MNTINASTPATERQARVLEVLTRFVDPVGWTRPATNSEEVRGIEEQFLPNVVTALDEAGLLADVTRPADSPSVRSTGPNELRIDMTATITVPDGWKPVSGRPVLTNGDHVPANRHVITLTGAVMYHSDPWTNQYGPAVEVEPAQDEQ